MSFLLIFLITVIALLWWKYRFHFIKDTAKNTYFVWRDEFGKWHFKQIF